MTRIQVTSASGVETDMCIGLARVTLPMVTFEMVSLTLTVPELQA